MSLAKNSQSDNPQSENPQTNNSQSNNQQPFNAALNNKKISFIGGGNMAQALISGLIGCGVQPNYITVADPSAEVRAQLDAKGLNTVDPTTDAKAAVIAADVVILAVKPQVMKAVVSGFADALDSQLIISVAAGLSSDILADMLGGYRTIVRAMPNTPAMIQMGATGLYGTDDITPAQKQLATAAMEASGLVMWVDNEEKMHAVTAVSGSAPAYMFYFIESMVDGAVALGLDKEQASALALQTMLGAAKMAMDSEDSPSELRRKVTSPNGTTQAAIESMQGNDIARQIGDAMQACYDRSQALSEEMK